jgi:hypothetical protein
LRIVVAFLAKGHMPTDTAVWFHKTALSVRHGQDPLGHFADDHWNFLPTLPYVWSLLLRLHVSWPVTDKSLAIAADCVNTVLVAALATSRKRLRAFQYAVSPLALLVTSWHGQIEPIVLACALTGLLLLRRRKNLLAGAMVGLAASIKTWPIVFAFALFRGTPRRRWLGLLASIAAVPFVVYVTMPLFLTTDLTSVARDVLGYRSLIGWFGWSALINILRGTHRIGLRGGIITLEQRISTTMLVVAAVAVLWVWRRARAEVFMLALLLAFIITAAGFGMQYLMWPLPLAIAFATRRTWLYLWSSAAYGVLFYLHPFTVRNVSATTLGRWSIPVVICAALALPFDQRVDPSAESATAEVEGDVLETDGQVAHT